MCCLLCRLPSVCYEGSAAPKLMSRASRASKIPLVRVDGVRAIPDSLFVHSDVVLASKDDFVSPPFEAPELTEAERLRLADEIGQASTASIAKWKAHADRGEWEEVAADLSLPLER